MGIRGLETYIDKAKGKFSRNLEKLIKNEVERGLDTKPTLVVDVKNCVRLFDPSKDSYGGQFKEIKENITKFVERIAEAGGKVVAFYDSIHDRDEERQHEWVAKQSGRMKEIEEAFNIEKFGSFNIMKVAEDTCVQCTLRSLDNCELIYSLTDCDQDIVKYIKENKCFALLSNDTDFLAFEYDKFYLLSPRDLNLDTFDTFYYNRDVLRGTLSLKQNQMPLFASLSGNDNIPPDKLKCFHRKLGINHYNQKFDKVAHYIRSQSFNDLTDDDVSTIASFALINEEHLLESISIYKCQKPVTKIPPLQDDESQLINMVYQKHKTAETIPTLFEFLHDREMYSLISIEDTKSIKIHNWLEPLRRRIYRIIYNKIDHNREITEYEIRPTGCVKKIVKPYSKEITDFKLVEVWQDENYKWEALAWCVNPQIDVQELRRIAEIGAHYVLPALALLYIFYQKPDLMTPEEIDLLTKHIAQAKSSTFEGSVSRSMARGIDLAGKFHHICAQLYFLNGVCGNCVPLADCSPVYYFDGKLFHHSFMEGKINLTASQKPIYDMLAEFIGLSYET